MAPGLQPGKQHDPERILRGKVLQHPLPVFIVEGTIAIPLQAGDRHRLVCVPAWVPSAAGSGQCRGHGSALVEVDLIL